MLRIANELVKRGHTVDIFTMSWEGELPQEGIRTHLLPVTGWLNYRRYQRFIEQAHTQIAAANTSGDGYDYIVGFNRMHGLDAYFAADPCFKTRAFTQRNFLYRLTPRNKWFAECERAIFEDSASEILLLSNDEKVEFQRWYHTPDRQFHFIPPFLSAARLALQDKAEMRKHIREAFGFGDGDFIFLLVGSGFYMKGLDRAIKALAALPPALLANTRLLAVGQDNPKPFIKLAAGLGVQKNLHISKGRPDIPQLMQGADSYVHPAYRENTGLVLLEALASGLPVLATASCGYAHHIEQADAGLVAAMPFDQAAFNRLFEAMVTSSRRADWSKHGIAYAQTLMRANDGSAEARILNELAINKSALAAHDKAPNDEA